MLYIKEYKNLKCKIQKAILICSNYTFLCICNSYLLWKKDQKNSVETDVSCNQFMFSSILNFIRCNFASVFFYSKLPLYLKYLLSFYSTGPSWNDVNYAENLDVCPLWCPVFWPWLVVLLTLSIISRYCWCAALWSFQPFILPCLVNNDDGENKVCFVQGLQATWHALLLQQCFLIFTEVKPDSKVA